MATPTARDETRTKITGRGVLTGATALVVTTLRKNITFNCTANTHIIMLLLFIYFPVSSQLCSRADSFRPSLSHRSLLPGAAVASRRPDARHTMHTAPHVRRYRAGATRAVSCGDAAYEETRHCDRVISPADTRIFPSVPLPLRR